MYERKLAEAKMISHISRHEAKGISETKGEAKLDDRAILNRS
jgi:hypothetical protein